ncbi:MAG TPA: hypothetical protein VFE33_05430 [Thermoanaerobaculia bacterium]|nr:hypothetical protein [Thermoanaerobaculia bacterium]
MPHRVTPRPFQLPLAGLPLLALLVLPGCGGAGGADGAGSDARQGVPADPEWLWLQQNKKELDLRRERREQLAAQGSAARESAEATRLARETDALAAELDRRLVDYVNAHPPVQGEPLTARQRAALRMKSDEDLEVARAYLEKGGDPQRAAEICEAALAVDPDNPRLKEELEKIRAARFMTAERFREVKEGMTPREVRELLGAPNPHNVRAYPERGIEAWFYTKDPAGAAAGVWFEKRSREEDTRVYQLDFDAIRPAAPPANKANKVSSSGGPESPPGASRIPPTASETPPGASRPSPGGSGIPPAASGRSPGGPEISPAPSRPPPGASEIPPGGFKIPPGPAKNSPGASRRSPDASGGAESHFPRLGSRAGGMKSLPGRMESDFPRMGSRAGGVRSRAGEVESRPGGIGSRAGEMGSRPGGVGSRPGELFEGFPGILDPRTESSAGPGGDNALAEFLTVGRRR